MTKIKVRRSVDGKPAELEIEESELQEGDEKITAPPPDKGEKTLTQAEVNKLMAEERRKHKAELDKISGDFAEYRKGIEEREQAANEAAEKKAAELRKGLPDSVTKLLDHLTPIEQVEWLSDPANATLKKTIPPLPPERDEPGKAPRVQTIV